jgi:hypothetical protein
LGGTIVHGRAIEDAPATASNPRFQINDKATLRCNDEFYACTIKIKAMTWDSNFTGRLVLLSVHDWLADDPLKKARVPENANALLETDVPGGRRRGNRYQHHGSGLCQ